MIAEGFEREKRSFHVGVRRIRAFAAHGLVHVAALLLVFSVALPLVGVRAQDGDGLPVPLDTDVAGQDEADAAMFLPWPEASTSEGDDRENVSDADNSDGSARVFDPERLAMWPVLRIGMVLDPAQGEFGGVEPFRANLEERLGIPAVVVAFSSLTRLQAGLLRGEVDYASLSTTAFVDAQERCSCLDPLAVPMDEAGVSGWILLAIVPKGRRFSGLESLGSARIALAPEGSTAGRRLPLALLEAAGVSSDEVRLVEEAGPLEAVGAVLSGRADVAFGWRSATRDGTFVEGGTLAALLARNGVVPAVDAIPLLGPIPSAPHVARTDLPESLRQELRGVLATWSDSGERPAGSGAFQPVSQKDFDLLAPLTAGGGAKNAVRGRLRPLVPR